MSRLQKEAIQRICINEETTAAALELLGTASLCTGPGTGYDLREGASGLPAVCAYLASEELGYGEVSAKIAQTASCLAPKVWQATLKTVRNALEAVHQPPEEEEAGSLDYEDLIKEYRIGRSDFVAASMKDIENSLLKAESIPEDIPRPRVAMKVSIFTWVCANVIKMRVVSPEAVLSNYDVHQRDYDDIVEIIVSSCQDAIQRARQKVENLRAKTLAASKGPKKAAAQRAAASATTPAASPSKPAAAAESDRDAPPSPQKTPTRKRKVGFAELDDVDYDLLDTPSKRPRTSSPAKARTITTPAAPTAPAPGRTPNPDAISPMKQSRPAVPPPRLPLPALAMPKPSIFPSTKRAAVQSPLDLLAQRSSSRGPLPNGTSPARTTRAQTRTLAQPAPSHAQPAPKPEPVAGPSTPRRRGRPPKAGTPAAARVATPARATPSQKRVPAALAALEDEEDEERRPHRFRPIFMDRRQWFQRDPRVEREWRMVEARMREERARNVVRSC